MSPLRSQNAQNVQTAQQPVAGAVPGAGVPTNNAAAPAAGGLPGPAPNTAGPHRHDIANKLDPTVDSQHSGTQILGPGIHGQSARADSAGAIHAHGQQAGVHDGIAAPHNSYAANTIDPRVDSRQANLASGTQAHGGLAGTGNLANPQAQPSSNFNPAQAQLQPAATTTSHAASHLYKPAWTGPQHCWAASPRHYEQAGSYGAAQGSSPGDATVQNFLKGCAF